MQDSYSTGGYANAEPAMNIDIAASANCENFFMVKPYIVESTFQPLANSLAAATRLRHEREKRARENAAYTYINQSTRKAVRASRITAILRKSDKVVILIN